MKREKSAREKKIIYLAKIKLKALSTKNLTWGNLLFFFLSLAYAVSQDRDQIRAVAAGLHHSHSNIGSDLHHSSRQHQILNLLMEARDQTCVLLDNSWVR